MGGNAGDVAHRTAGGRYGFDEDLGRAHAFGEPSLHPLRLADDARDSQEPPVGGLAARGRARHERVGPERLPRHAPGLDPRLEEPFEETLGVEEVRAA